MFAPKCNKSFEFLKHNAKCSVPQSEASENLDTLSQASSHQQGTDDKNRGSSLNAGLLTVQPCNADASPINCY
jgi:hypothetical protein